MWGNYQVSGFLQSLGGADSFLGRQPSPVAQTPPTFILQRGLTPVPRFPLPRLLSGKSRLTISCREASFHGSLPLGPGQDLGAFLSQGRGLGF